MTVHKVNFGNVVAPVKIVGVTAHGVVVTPAKPNRRKGLGRNQHFEVRQDEIIRESSRETRNRRRMEAFLRKKRAESKAARTPLDGPEGHSERVSPTLRAVTPVGGVECRVCGIEHAGRQCSMSVVLDQK